MKNQSLADLFFRLGTLLEIKGENAFKVRAYQTAAENILNLSEDISALRQENRLADVPGIGDALRQKICEYLDTGKVSAYEKLTAEIPESLLEVVSVPTVGPKKAKLFFEELRIKDLPGLRQAAQNGKLLGLPGIKEKTVLNIMNGIKLVAARHERMDIATATQTAEGVIAALKPLPEVKAIVAAGSLRRQKESIRDIDILIDSPHPAKVMDAFVHLPSVKEIYSHGETKSSILTQDDIQVDLRVVEHKCFGAALLHFTGSKEFNVRLRQLAIAKGMKVSEYGIFKVEGDRERMVAGKTEKECFKALNFPCVPPEMREEIGAEEIFVQGSKFKVPRLVELKDIRGDLHVHSNWSDGHEPMEKMAEAARAKGYEYVAISDHSVSLKVANGLSRESVMKKKAQVEELNKKYRDFRILLGTEVEIDSQGNLDYNSAILCEFDVVIAAVHTGLEQGAQAITRRIVKACRNKYVHAIAHPTCVHLGKRDPVAVDLLTVCRAAVDHNVCLEINAFPVRLDLNSVNAHFARTQGVKFMVNTDAHRSGHLDFMRFGVSVARRGWLTAGDVVNTLPLKEMLQALKK